MTMNSRTRNLSFPPFPSQQLSLISKSQLVYFKAYCYLLATLVRAEVLQT